MLAAVVHGTLLAFGLILPLGPQSVRRQVLFAAAGRLVGRVGALRRVLDRVSAVTMWTTALYLARQLRVAR